MAVIARSHSRMPGGSLTGKRITLLGGVSIRGESDSLFLTADSFQQGLVQRIALMDSPASSPNRRA